MINGQTLQNLLLMFFGLVLIGVGLSVAAAHKKGKLPELANTGLHVIVSIVIVGLGAGAIAWAAFGKKILETFGISTG